MFFYSFSTYHGFDRVLYIETKEGNPGDLFLIDGKYMLCMGQTVSFTSLYNKHTVVPTKIILIEKQLVKAKTIDLIHDFVTHRFTTYKNAIPLWITDEIDTLLKRKPHKRNQKSEIRNQKNTTTYFDTTTYNIYTGTNIQSFNQALISYLGSPISIGQRCIIFPSLWILGNTLDIEKVKLVPGTILLSSKTSSKQKEDAFRAIKTGAAHTLIATHSQIFQDRHDLQYILLIDHHTRYYKNQQDPRYHTVDLCKAMAENYGAHLDMTGISLSM